MGKQARKTTVGSVNEDVLAYTAGEDITLDLRLVEADCLGTAAHVTMLSRLPLDPPILTPAESGKVIAELVAILRTHTSGGFVITIEDQDVHLAVERVLTARLGDLGRKVHTARSRNDQVAVDLRLYGKQELLAALDETAALARSLLAFAHQHQAVPMVGRTHMQPAMPSSVGLWASSYAEALLDDAASLMHAYELNDQCPLGSAASYGVPLPIDRELVSDLLGFSRPTHNVLYANNARGKLEAVILSALTQLMVSLSRLAQDLVLFSLPEFGYLSLPAALCTGSSIMPQKRNPDVLETVRAKAARVLADTQGVWEILRAAPSGYNRDLQETKKPFLEGMATTRATLRIMKLMIEGVQVHAGKLLAAFTPEVFATDKALELAIRGTPFRVAYQRVKEQLEELAAEDPRQAIARKTHLGGTGALGLDRLSARVDELGEFVADERAEFHAAASRLLGTAYPPEG